MNESTDLAYAAGYIDGDGCFYIGKVKTSPFYQETFSVVSTSLDNIEWFNQHFKGRINFKKTKQKNRLPSYHFVFLKEGYESLKTISQFLVEKKRECDIFLKFYANDVFEDRNYLIELMHSYKHECFLIPNSIKGICESIRHSAKPSREDFAYLAGFIDAECSLDISKTNHKKGKNPCYRTQLQCNNTKSPFFYWAAQRFGGQFHFLNKSHIPKARNQMLWRLSCKQLLSVLEGVHPFLKHKKPMCTKMIEFQKLNYSRKGAPSPNSPHYAAFYEPILKAKESIYNEVRHLNNSVI